MKNSYFITVGLNSTDLEHFNNWYNWLTKESIFGKPPSKAEAIRLAIKITGILPILADQIERIEDLIEEAQKELVYLDRLKKIIAENK